MSLLEPLYPFQARVNQAHKLAQGAHAERIHADVAQYRIVFYGRILKIIVEHLIPWIRDGRAGEIQCSAVTINHHLDDIWIDEIVCCAQRFTEGGNLYIGG